MLHVHEWYVHRSTQCLLANSHKKWNNNKQEEINGWTSADPAGVLTPLLVCQPPSSCKVAASSPCQYDSLPLVLLANLYLSSGLEILIACCTVTFPAQCLSVTYTHTHTLYFPYCSFKSLASLPPPSLPLSVLLFLSILHSLRCLCDRSDRLYNVSLRICLTFNISIKCQWRLV